MKIPDPLESPTLKAGEVAPLWRVSTWHVYEMVKTETCPVPPIRVGRSLRWPTVPVLRGLGLAPEAGATEAGPTLKVVSNG